MLQIAVVAMGIWRDERALFLSLSIPQRYYITVG